METESDKLLQEILDYRQGKGKYNFSRLSDYDRENAIFDAWENIEYRIRTYLDSLKTSQDFDSMQKHIEKWSAS